MKVASVMFMPAIVLLVLAATTDARNLNGPRPNIETASAVTPQIQATEHTVANMALTVTNKGMLGASEMVTTIDCFTGATLRNCEFPINSRTTYLYGGAIWIGGVVGSDTLVSVGFDGWQANEEFNPDVAPMGQIEHRSTLSNNPVYRQGAVSHQDFTAIFYDTCKTCYRVTNDVMDHRPHQPLGIRVTQHSYAWNYPYAADFVLFDLNIANIGTSQITNGYIGIYVDADVYADGNYGSQDDLTGFVSSLTDPSGSCPYTRQIPIAWIADNDGDLLAAGQYVPNVTGTALLRGPGEAGPVSYNWWTSNSQPVLDFGPMRKSNTRDFGTNGTGTPEGDRNKYWLLSNGDIDFDQVYTASIGPDDTIWQYPPHKYAGLFSVGTDAKYLLSIGPFDLSPGQSVPLVFAYVGGMNFHTNPGNIQYLPHQPATYEQNLNFSDLERNALWASWIYDNPGVDTDSDGYAGTFVVCGSDTTWTAGDGIADYRAAVLPLRPMLWATPINGGVQIRWNGFSSESTPDAISQQLDFEGYYVYFKKTGDPEWHKAAGYDKEDYYVVAYDTSAYEWRIDHNVRSDSALRCLFAPGRCADSAWSPLGYSKSHPFIKPEFADSLFYFIPVGCNNSKFGVETSIQKTHPTAPFPHFTSPSAVPADSTAVYLTPDGYFKYYEYRCTLSKLLAGDSYDVNVTAIDYGPAFVDGFYPQESSVDEGAVTVTPLISTTCCVGATGNVDCDAAGEVDIADLTALIDYLYISLNPPCCMSAANVDGSSDGMVDISDLTALIDYQFVRFTPPAACR